MIGQFPISVLAQRQALQRIAAGGGAEPMPSSPFPASVLAQQQALERIRAAQQPVQQYEPPVSRPRPWSVSIENRPPRYMPSAADAAAWAAANAAPGDRMSVSSPAGDDMYMVRTDEGAMAVPESVREEVKTAPPEVVREAVTAAAAAPAGSNILMWILLGIAALHGGGK